MDYKRYLLCCSMLLLSIQTLADPTNNPCASSNSILTFIDRPSKSDSACAAPVNTVISEMGYQYGSLIGSGSWQSFPQLELRAGLPADTELFVLTPNYNLETVAPHAGFNATTLGIKHVFHYTDKSVWTAEAEVTPPSGGATFGSGNWGGIINGIATYNVTNTLSASLQLGVSSQTWPSAYQSQRYNSFNPDGIVSWQINPKTSLYGELFAQTQVAPHQGAGMNFDGGIVYLLTNRLSIDAEIGQRITGELGGYDNYIGTGLAWMIG